MRAIAWIAAAAAACSLIGAAALASGGEDRGQAGNAGMNALQDRTSTGPAGALFVEKCAMCHRQFGMGTVILARRMPQDMAMLERRDDLTKAYVVYAARMGVGNMPPVPRGELSDAELDAIAAYLAGADRP